MEDEDGYDFEKKFADADRKRESTYSVNYKEQQDFDAIPDLIDMKAQSVAEPTWSEHKLELGVAAEEDDIPKLLTDADVEPQQTPNSYQVSENHQSDLDLLDLGEQQKGSFIKRNTVELNRADLSKVTNINPSYVTQDQAVEEGSTPIQPKVAYNENGQSPGIKQNQEQTQQTSFVMPGVLKQKSMTVAQKAKGDRNVGIHCVTMNCGGQSPGSLEDLLPIFEVRDQKSINEGFVPDIYVVALQEIVKLNAKNCLMKDTKKIELWRTMLTKVLGVINKRHEKGKILTEQQKFDQELVYTDGCMVGCYLAVFVKRKLLQRVKTKSFQICKIKSGTMGTTGNKGAICLRFQLDDQAIMLINCHLISGRRRDQQRMDQLGKIFEQAFINNLRNRGMAIEAHNQVILLGDLNFRINTMTRQEVMDRIQQEDINSLLDQDNLVVTFDQMSRTKKSMENKYQEMLFKQFQEGVITFMPTYKYDLRSNSYDTSKKQRVPAFCDRILWKRNPDIQQLYYNNVQQIDFTDHRPVVAHYNLTINTINNNQKQKKPSFVDFLQNSYQGVKNKKPQTGPREKSPLSDQQELGYERRDSRLILPEDEDEINPEPIADEFDGMSVDNGQENGPSSDEEEEKTNFN